MMVAIAAMQDTLLFLGVCPKCKKTRTPNGHDPCIANLPGVRFACCGHGLRDGYIYFENGIRIGMSVIEVEQYDPSEDSNERVRTDAPTITMETDMSDQPNSPREVVDQHRAQTSANATFIDGHSESVTELAFLPDGTNQKGGTLQVGVVLVSKDPAGRDLTPPCHCIGFAVGSSMVSIVPDVAREMAKYLTKFCDAADAMNGNPAGT